MDLLWKNISSEDYDGFCGYQLASKTNNPFYKVLKQMYSYKNVYGQINFRLAFNRKVREEEAQRGTQSFTLRLFELPLGG